MGITVRRIARLWRIEEVLATANVGLLSIHQNRVAIKDVVPSVARVRYLIVPALRQHWRPSAANQATFCSAGLVNSMNEHAVLIHVIDARAVRCSPKTKRTKNTLALQPDAPCADSGSCVVVVNRDAAAHVADNSTKGVRHRVVVNFYGS